MKLILAHQYLARRLRWSMVYNEEKHRIFMEKHLFDCLTWCHEEGHSQVTVSDGETALLVTLAPGNLSLFEDDAATVAESKPK